MVDSVQGSHRHTDIAPIDRQQSGGVEKKQAVGLGYDQQNSISHLTGGALVQSYGQATRQPPSIPAPAAGANGAIGDIENQRFQHTLNSMKVEWAGGLEFLRSSNPELAARPGVEGMHRDINAKLTQIESAPPGTMKDLHKLTQRFDTGVADGTLTADKLEQILSELQTKLADSSIKYQQEQIRIDAQALQSLHNSNVKDIRDEIAAANVQTEGTDQAANKIELPLPIRILAGIFTLGMSEIALATERSKPTVSTRSTRNTNDNNGIPYRPSNFSFNSPSIDTPLDPEVYYGPELTDAEAPRNTDEVPERRPINDVAEGLDLAQQGMTQAEFMKLLKQLQESEDANEKLAEAIAALEAGDPELAKSILAGSSNDSADASGSTLEPDSTNGSDAEANESPDSGVESSDTEDQETAQEFHSFMDQIAKVPQATTDSQADSLRELAIMQRSRFG
ncbi:MAG: hypothetical protein ACR2PT_17905 [Endozoicomonas sp.]